MTRARQSGQGRHQIHNPRFVEPRVLPTLGAGALLVGLLAIASLIWVAGCSSTKREVKSADATPIRDVPQVLRGTIGAESEVRGSEPILISGLGIVVGLNGTGGGELPVQVQTTMERELARGGVGLGGASVDTDLGPVTPQQFLRSPNVAVVIVQAAVAPGAPRGTRFDVLVRTLPGSSVTSLEGGQLWTTELRIGPAAVFGAIKTRKIADAGGPIFINPFSAPSAGPAGEVQLTRTSGRVLGGGVITDPLKMELALDSDSPTRARSIVAAINSRFGPTDEGPIARGRGSSRLPGELPSKDKRNKSDAPNYQSIAITVPPAYQNEPADFIQLLKHVRVDQSFPQEYARAYVDELKNQPIMADHISWLLQAIGKPAIPFLGGMYDYPEFAPRMAALNAGARLGDQRSVQPLIELAKSGPPTLRTQAIKLLGNMPSNPGINLALRELISEPDLDIRVAAYEGLLKRGDPFIRTIVISGQPHQPRFLLDIVPDGDPLVYITQQGEARVVVFGSTPKTATGPGAGDRRSRYNSLMLNRPMLASVFSDRLLLNSEASDKPIRLMYQDPRTRQVVSNLAPDDLIEFINYLSRKGSSDDPAPGLGMSYSDVVATLYALTKQDALTAGFATEQDRLRAEIFDASHSTELSDRPENANPTDDASLIFKPIEPPAGPVAPNAPAGKLTHVVPLSTPSPSNPPPKGP